MTTITFALTLGLTFCGDPVGAEVARDALAEHYAAVERELRAADVSHLDAATRARRARAIELLADYRTAGLFGIGSAGDRGLLFVDAGGRRCAVANLLDHTGRGDLTLDVAAAHNDAWIAELAGDARFETWLHEWGLTLEEAARIQGPHEGPPPRPLTSGRATELAPRSRPDALGGLAAALGAATPPSSTFPGARPATTRADVPDAPATTSDATWREWWEVHRDAFLPAGRHGIGPWTVTPAALGFEGDAASGAELERERWIERLEGLVESEDVRVRSAATLALGRLGGSDVVPILEARLADPTVRVREDALLALGATASPRAVHLLHHIACNGSVPSAPSAGILPHARPLAVLSLGLAQRYGCPVDAAPLVRSIERSASGADADATRWAAFAFARLAGTDALEEPALAQALDRDAPPYLRCGALESLARGADMIRVLDALGSRDLELRRSAAATLGRSRPALALGPLMTAFEVEREHLTRGLALISIGRYGGDEARAFLLDVLRTGKRSSRPWSALALGVLARERGVDDPELARALREAAACEKNREHLGAYWIAAGLARDHEAGDGLREALASESAQLRIDAAQALAVLEEREARATLAERLERDPCPTTRTAIAEMLGYVGAPEDAERVAELLLAVHDPELEERLATALGRLGSRSALARLAGWVDDEGRDAGLRSAAVEAAGFMLSERPDGCLRELWRERNYAVTPSWFESLTVLTL